MIAAIVALPLAAIAIASAGVSASNQQEEADEFVEYIDDIDEEIEVLEPSNTRLLSQTESVPQQMQQTPQQLAQSQQSQQQGRLQFINQNPVLGNSFQPTTTSSSSKTRSYAAPSTPSYVNYNTSNIYTDPLGNTYNTIQTQPMPDIDENRQLSSSRSLETLTGAQLNYVDRNTLEYPEMPAQAAQFDPRVNLYANDTRQQNMYTANQNLKSMAPIQQQQTTKLANSTGFAGYQNMFRDTPFMPATNSGLQNPSPVIDSGTFNTGRVGGENLSQQRGYHPMLSGLMPYGSIDTNIQTSDRSLLPSNQINNTTLQHLNPVMSAGQNVNMTRTPTLNNQTDYTTGALQPVQNVGGNQSWSVYNSNSSGAESLLNYNTTVGSRSTVQQSDAQFNATKTPSQTFETTTAFQNRAPAIGSAIQASSTALPTQLQPTIQNTEFGNMTTNASLPGVGSLSSTTQPQISASLSTSQETSNQMSTAGAGDFQGWSVYGNTSSTVPNLGETGVISDPTTQTFDGQSNSYRVGSSAELESL